MLSVFTITIVVLIAIVAVIAAGIVTVRLARTVGQRKQAVLAAGPRRALLAFVADNGEDGGHDLVAIPDDAWKAAEAGALGLLGKLRGEAHQALVSVFPRRGTARAALRDLRSRSRVRRARAAQILGDLARAALEPLTDALSPARPAPLRAAAARALGELGAPSAVPALVALLDDDEYRVAYEAAHALRRLGRPGQEALRAVVTRERADALAGGHGAHARPSASASHAREALALASVGAEPEVVGAA